MAVAAILIFLRMYFFSVITQEMSLVIAIMSTFVATSETEIEEQIKEPGSIVQIATVFKILKTSLTIMVFTYNGNVNDYFVGLFFFYTGYIGMCFFDKAGLKMPQKDYYQDEEDELEVEITPDNLDNDNLAIYFDRVMTKNELDLVKKIKDNNVQKLQFRCLVFFGINITLMYKLEPVFNFLGAGTNDQDYKVTTLGISSTIMILYNMIAWPYIHEQQELKPPIQTLKTERERAWLLINQLDVITDFCSSIMGKISSLATGDDQKEDDGAQGKDYHNGTVRLYNAKN